MTLKPIPGAPIDARIPDFPTGQPDPLLIPPSHATRRTVAPAPSSPPPSTSSPARRPGPVEIRGNGGLIISFRVIPEVPAINRASLTITIAGEPPRDELPQTTPRLDLTTDQAKAFLLALRDGNEPIVIGDSRTAFQVEFTNAEDGPTFTISQPGQARTVRRFNAGWSFDVESMAAHLLADLGP
jgi:hypothetical protein